MENNLEQEIRYKKPLNDEVRLKRRENMLKALAKKRSLYENKLKNKDNINKISENINEILNNNIDDNSSNSEQEIKPKKTKKQETNINTYENDFKLMLNNINNKVEKLYIMKKTKTKQPQPQPQPQPIILDNKNYKSNELLESIRNKLLNN